MPRPPDVGVGTAVLLVRGNPQGGDVLLGLRKGAHGAGCWSAPGGWIDRSDKTIEDACAREVLEETGIVINSHPRVLHPVLQTTADYPDYGFRTVTLFYATFVAAFHFGEGLAYKPPLPREPDKCVEWRWFPVLQPPSPLFDGVGEALEAFYEKIYLPLQRNA